MPIIASFTFSESSVLSHQAKETLTDPEKRSRYDKWLNSGLSVSFKQWESLKGAVNTSMHWATPKTLGRMISEQKEKMRASFSMDKSGEVTQGLLKT